MTPFSRKTGEGARRADEGASAVAVVDLLLSHERQKPKLELELSLPFGERVTSLCLCKEMITKRNTPCLRVHAAMRRGSTPPAGFFDETSLSRRKTTHIHVRRPYGVLSVSSVASEGAQQVKSQSNSKIKTRARAPLPNPPLAYGKGREQSCTLRGERAELRSARAKQKRRHRIPST